MAKAWKAKRGKSIGNKSFATLRTSCSGCTDLEDLSAEGDKDGRELADFHPDEDSEGEVDYLEVRSAAEDVEGWGRRYRRR